MGIEYGNGPEYGHDSQKRKGSNQRGHATVSHLEVEGSSKCPDGLQVRQQKPTQAVVHVQTNSLG